MRPATKAAYRLMHEGMETLSKIEANGMRVDVHYLDRTSKMVDHKIDHYEQQLKESDEWQIWRRRFQEPSLGSPQQLGTVLFDELGHEPTSRTATGKPSVDVRALQSINTPFVVKYLRWKKLQKLQSTYLKAIRREVVDGYLHPSFNLHLVRSYRSSSSSPNFQNIPAHDPVVSKLIRRAFVPRPGCVLLEIDYSAIEVRVAACYHKDPTMVHYIEDGYDMHRDMAAECFLLDVDNVSKTARSTAKNKFVFAEFYGDYYPSVARNLWRSIEDGLQAENGTPIKQYLAKMGIHQLGACDPQHAARPGTYEHHIQHVERLFWEERFPRYANWKDWHWKRYQERGWFRTKTGFVCHGVFKRNEAINYPVQGSAFHCLLWSLVRANKTLALDKMATQIVGQIHDSILFDVPEKELDDVLVMAHKVMTQDLRKAWPWLIVPLEVEAEMSAEDWYSKQPIELGK